jgi:subtilase family serine protease
VILADHGKVLSSKRFLAALSTLLACGCALIPAVASADTVPVGEAATLPEGATLEGPVAPQRPLELLVALEPRDPEALRAYAEEVTTPGSPVYGQYLSVSEFAQRFGATEEAMTKVTEALESQGLTVGTAPRNHLSLPVEATAQEAEAAFGTEIERIQTPEGEPGYLSTSAPEIAADAAPYVVGVVGLDDLGRPHRSHAASAPSPLASLPAAAVADPTAGLGPQPCAAAIATQTANPADGIGYTAEKLAAAYDFDKLYAAGNFGAGQTIALFEEEAFRTSDIEAFQQCYGTHATLETVQIGAPFESEDEEEEEKNETGGEAVLDISQAIQLAPSAHVIVYSSNEANSEAAILSKWVSENRAKVMSDSYGICEKNYKPGNPGFAATEMYLQEAAVQGQTFVVASGDYGAADCSQQKPAELQDAVDYPGSDPFATDIGGTRLEEPTAPQPLEYLWNDYPKWGAGGGGISAHFSMPEYQLKSDPSLHVLSDLSSGIPCGFAGYCRQVPDVSADASAETGYVVYVRGNWEVTGGTSAAAPLWGALATLANASPACDGHPVGFLNPALYSIAGTDYASSFRDIVVGKPGGPQTNNRKEAGKPFPAGPGYDMATGLGVPIADGLTASLCALSNPPAPPAPPEPARPDPGDQKAAPAPATAPPASVAHLRSSRLGGTAKGTPKLTLGLEARPGASLEAVTVTLPPGLVAAATHKSLAAGIAAQSGGKRLKVAVRRVRGSIQVRLLSPTPWMSLQIGAPALTATEKLRERVESRKTKKVSLVVVTKESGAQTSRFPLTLGP